MADPLHDSMLKIERARTHAHAIEDLIRAFANHAFEPVDLKFDPDEGEHVFVLTELRHPDNDTLGLLISEFLHNARSALDNLAWQLVHRPAVNPGVPKAPDDKIAFPICSSPTAFQNALKKIRGCTPGVEAVIERLQPYYTGKDALFEGQDALWLLQELNNWDKHRFIHLVENELSFAGFIDQDGAIKESTTHAPGRLKAGAELARYSLQAVFDIDADVDVGFHITTGVTFEEGPAANRVVNKVSAEILYALGQAATRLRPFIA